jgi:hypothetical protein
VKFLVTHRANGPLFPAAEPFPPFDLRSPD